MLQLLATDEFADWFHALGDSDAEDVAIALEVLGSVSVEQADSSSSDLLLWYRASPADSPGSRGNRALAVSDTYHRAAARIFRMITHLDSQPVQARLAQVPADQQVLVRCAISKMKSLTRDRRLAAMMVRESESERVVAEVEANYRAVLDACDLLEPESLLQTTPLRQLQLNDRPPGLRILYGVNAAKETALLVLGEHLDRRAYGSSVRRALSEWKRFLAGEELSSAGPSPTPGAKR